MVSVTKLGGKQKRIKLLIGQYGALSWTQLETLMGMEQSDLRKSLRAMVAAGAVVHVWDSKGRAVYRLPEREKSNVS